ncbi:ABC transporter substrate-binding protein [Bacterioplanoides sp. SCSIO 12839]|uniref:ABC transporter substrate-binding protein n=1 Tax=Bacterioplanoides sp. SCSIO 12839 TaxID=2829569 RepID=UPI0021034ECC|nr:ABC transporter substrate-binding protein [Bacterioplanoides sp. SCSIO 12839]UTW49974.1 ABC transporter substrate-binding protein [Bacterioplanoides sp. SCSIO 12839]
MILCIRSLLWLLAMQLPLLSLSLHAAPYERLRIYLDADQTGAAASGRSIMQGISLALSRQDNQIQGVPVEIIIKDHRGNSRRSLAHLKTFLKDEQGLAVVSGLHSPPLLAHKDFINNSGILMLTPWAAAGPITRRGTNGLDDERWIFRLSIDDTKAGQTITHHALNEGFKSPFLLLEDTGWGRSNNKTMMLTLKEHGLQPAGLHWFHWGLSEDSARIILRDINRSGADVIFMVANAQEGKAISRALLSLPESQRLPVRSHWGITGGNFAEDIGKDGLSRLDLKFIQTRFSFAGQLTPYAKDVFSAAKAHFEEIESPEDIKAPTGFIHGYDLMTLFLNAANQITFSGDIDQDRLALRDAMYQLKTSQPGLVKDYQQPFSKVGIDGHEALNQNDYVMGYFTPDGNIRLE